MATHRSSADGSNNILPSRLSRRRFAQGLAAAPMVLGAATRGIAPVRAQDKVQIKFWTHTHPPMVDQNNAADRRIHGGQSGHRGPVRSHPQHELRREDALLDGDRDRPRRDQHGRQPDAGDLHSPRVGPGSGSRGARLRLDGRAERRLYPGRLRGRDVDGKIYGLPSEFNVTAFAINTEAFEEVGLDPASPPKTWDEVGDDGPEAGRTRWRHVDAARFRFPLPP